MAIGLLVAGWLGSLLLLRDGGALKDLLAALIVVCAVAAATLLYRVRG